jgi:uncharacterized membrane protein YfcA
MLLSIFVGIVIGLVLGLTGAGGSIFALPLLILLLDVPPHEAVGIALCAVAVSSIFGTLTRLKSGEIEWLPALMFAFIGSLVTPLGTWLNTKIPETFILLGFFAIVIFVSQRMWRQADQHPEQARVSRAQISKRELDASGAYCRMNEKQAFEFGPRCFIGMLGGASLVGLLSGLFGVGGGFIIVPTLMFLTGISIQQAVATSLLIISAVSSSALLSFFAQGTLNIDALLLQVSLGGLLGMLLGILVGKKISGPQLQKSFSVTMLILSSLVIAKHFQVF